jgi:hypothetical protein
MGSFFVLKKVMKWNLSNFICGNNVKKTVNTLELFFHFLGGQMDE